MVDLQGARASRGVGELRVSDAARQGSHLYRAHAPRGVGELRVVERVSSALVMSRGSVPLRARAGLGFGSFLSSLGESRPTRLCCQRAGALRVPLVEEV